MDQRSGTDVNLHQRSCSLRSLPFGQLECHLGGIYKLTNNSSAVGGCCDILSVQGSSANNNLSLVIADHDSIQPTQVDYDVLISEMKGGGSSMATGLSEKVESVFVAVFDLGSC